MNMPNAVAEACELVRAGAANTMQHDTTSDLTPRLMCRVDARKLGLVLAWLDQAVLTAPPTPSPAGEGLELDGLEKVALAAADEGAWCWEQCGDKCDAPVVGIAYRADDPDFKNVTGRLREWDDDGREIQYERTRIAEINETIRSPSSYARHIATFDPPTVLALIAGYRAALSRQGAGGEGGGELRAVVEELGGFLGEVGGTCLGVAMSGDHHPNPDGALMGLFEKSQSLTEKVRATLSSPQQSLGESARSQPGCAASPATSNTPTSGKEG